MKLLINGARGQVGVELLKLFKKQNYKLIPINRKEWDMSINPNQGYDLIIKYKPDLVINAAAYTSLLETRSLADFHADDGHHIPLTSTQKTLPRVPC